jgi:predicted PurR-regulated permease PerM
MYKIYKFHYDLKRMPSKEKIYIILLILFSIFALLISLFLYDIVLPLIITSIIIVISYLALKRIKKMDSKIRIGFYFIYIAILSLIIPMVLIRINPFIWKINQQISENITQSPEIKEFVLLLNESTYKLIPLNASFANITLDDICRGYNY